METVENQTDGILNGTNFIWTGGELPESSDMPQVVGAKFHLINSYEPERTGYNWLKGVALARYEGRWVASFGQNSSLLENNATEVANFRISSDEGQTWGPLHNIDNPSGDLAVSPGLRQSRAES